ncbi:hypothetical protein MKEN_00915900 [Mycena kentingensis (nom. inval.)]|nr:hypothetical protein MKEN_00915900 [Mycena kentingensis (nom. inval.)]
MPSEPGRSSRILTVASSLSSALNLVDRIKGPQPEQHKIEQSGLAESASIPWSISNKYYSADVHFQAHSVTGLAPNATRNLPAMIYVWPKGEAYKHHIERLAHDMREHEPEVALAVRLPPSETPPSDVEDEAEDETEIDEFLSSNGFEFIDVSEEAAEDDSGLENGIPGLPRVIDALSTIMWPSMQTHTRAARLQQDLDWAQTSQDDMSTVGLLGPSKSRQAEMEELARWLEDDETTAASIRDDPWKTAASISISPTDVNAPEFPNEFGFDDDFTVFVSAPPEDTSADEDEEEEDDDTPARLGLPDSSPLYLSLGSGVDLDQVPDEEEDMPTDAEIDAMAARIFGVPLRDDAPEIDVAGFDLSRVMTTLEGVKADIAGMDDEAQKRKAAASVAISLVYGLQGGETE